jgi:uracil-DNA glycosylase
MAELDLLKWYKEMGVDEMVGDKKRDYQKQEKVAVQRQIVPPRNFSGPKELANKAREIADTCGTVEELRQAIFDFKDLPICKTATNTVFSDGNVKSKVMVIGEAPGANEDVQGIPFCGVSGKLLDKILASIGLVRKDNVYITNSVFWRPPGNRRPTPEESLVCLPFVERHIYLMAPKLILLVGGTAASAVLGNTEPVSRIRNKTFKYSNQYLKQDLPVIVTFHPSYLLRQPSQKKFTWQDMLKVKTKFLDN